MKKLILTSELPSVFPTVLVTNSLSPFRTEVFEVLNRVETSYDLDASILAGLSANQGK